MGRDPQCGVLAVTRPSPDRQHLVDGALSGGLCGGAAAPICRCRGTRISGLGCPSQSTDRLGARTAHADRGSDPELRTPERPAGILHEPRERRHGLVDGGAGSLRWHHPGRRQRCALARAPRGTALTDSRRNGDPDVPGGDGPRVAPGRDPAVCMGGRPVCRDRHRDHRNRSPSLATSASARVGRTNRCPATAAAFAVVATSLGAGRIVALLTSLLMGVIKEGARGDYAVYGVLTQAQAQQRFTPPADLYP